MTSSSPYDPPDPSAGLAHAGPPARSRTPWSRRRARSACAAGAGVGLARSGPRAGRDRPGVALARSGGDAAVRRGPRTRRRWPPTRRRRADVAAPATGYPHTGGGPASPPRPATARCTAATGRCAATGWRSRTGTGQDADAFAATVDAVLGDPRSWIAAGELRLQRVAEAAAADFTVYLATPGTSERMCADGGLAPTGYTSCRLPGQVIINLARWLDGGAGLRRAAGGRTRRT